MSLADGFPQAVMVGGVEYEVDSDFRTALRIMEAFEDPGLTALDKQDVAIALLYGAAVPPDLAEAFDMAVFFLDGGERRAAGEAGEGGRLYSFSHDARYIYSAIQMTHGIDLAAADYMHWWRFCYLLQDLREDCYFQRMLYLRAKRLRGKLTREEREEWQRNEAVLMLPEYRDSEADAANADFMARYREAQERRSSHG